MEWKVYKKIRGSMRKEENMGGKRNVEGEKMKNEE